MKYTKPPLTFDEQIALLKSRGLEIPDDAKAKHRLAHLNYYRLRAYWMELEGPKRPNGEHSFPEGEDLEKAHTLYVFDRSLRLLVMDAIEQVEVSVRTQWAYHLANRHHDPHAFLNPALFQDGREHSFGLEALQKEFARSRETFIEHYRKTYDDPPLPPIWVMCEVMSLGQLSRWMSNLKLRADRQAIADTYDLDEQILCSFLGHLTYVRNLCAHHSRLWNRQFTITMRIPTKRPRHALSWFNRSAERRLYNTLAMLAVILQRIEPETDWPRRLQALIDRFPDIRLAAMGFPDDWRTFHLWIGH